MGLWGVFFLVDVVEPFSTDLRFSDDSLSTGIAVDCAGFTMLDTPFFTEASL
jgi:hypothetical protein